MPQPAGPPIPCWQRAAPRRHVVGDEFGAVAPHAWVGVLREDNRAPLERQSVFFSGPSERLVLSHHAEDRVIFAHGAVKAALWARDKKPGLYTMADVLGLQNL